MWTRHNIFKFYIPRLLEAIRIIVPDALKSIHKYAKGEQISDIFNFHKFYQVDVPKVRKK